MSKKPTDTELEILNVLWQHGPSTVRQVHDVLSAERDLGYTTVLKMLQVMFEKGFVVRDTSSRSHIYTPTHSEKAMKGNLVADLVDRAFAGSPTRLVLAALSERPASAEEIDAIRALLDQMEDT
ncbi:MAG: BlaI/MecI/CopY family transcriptional regulator [Deltaproteobacteria bacterium]|nr:MAG: BlaI/MecI/CopY family transcriptional regulator [Deltaproteobacteria bacterium]